MLEHFLPESAKAQPSEEALMLHQAAQDFRREVEYRQTFEHSCQRYYQTAQQHQQEFAALKKDINFFGWFCSSRR